MVPAEGPALNANKDKVVYELTFDLPNAGLQQPATALGDAVVIEPDVPPPPGGEAGERRYPLPSCRSVVGHQLYGQYAPQMTFLQLGEVQAHRSVVKANRLARMTKEERLMATTTHNILASDMIDDITCTTDPKLITDSEEEIKVWGYVMTQYNLKAGLRRFEDRGKTAAMEEMTRHSCTSWIRGR